MKESRPAPKTSKGKVCWKEKHPKPDCGHATTKIWVMNDGSKLCTNCMLRRMNEGGPEERCGDS